MKIQYGSKCASLTGKVKEFKNVSKMGHKFSSVLITYLTKYLFLKDTKKITT